MASDALKLLFELDVDSRSGTAGLQRFRKEIAATIDAARRAITQPLKSLDSAPITASAKAAASAQEREQRKLNNAVESLQRQRSSALIRAFKDQERAAQQTSRAQEREQRRLNNAVQSLQRQRSAALIRAFKDEERAAVASARAQERAAQQAARAVANAFRGIGPGLQSIGRTLTIGITAPLLALGAASLKSAKDIDANVNTLKAFTGSAEAAERRLAQLIKTSRATPGLTTNLALTLDAQLRTAKVTEETINRVLPAIGRLNAVSKLPDAGRFTQNLLQLVTQNFEKQDLKELVGQSPLAGQLITQIFNVDSPTNAKAIRAQAKKLGLTSVDAFITAFAEAAAKNQGLANVTESIGTRFDKLVDRVKIALRPLGLAILNAVEPFIEPVARAIESLSNAFNSLSPPVKTAAIVLAGLAAAAGPVLFALGSIVTSLGGVITAVTAIAAVVALIGFPELILVIGGLVAVIGEWVAILGALGLAWKTNFLNIRGLLTDAAGAVMDAFNRVKGVIQNIVEEVLPTLESITTKVIGAITLVWEQYGKRIVEIVGPAFRVIVDTTIFFLREFGNFIDLILKLIDGDWKGGWQAFSRIVIDAIERIPQLLRRLENIVLRALIAVIRTINGLALRFVFAAQQLAVKFATSLAAGIIKGVPQIRDALVDLFLSSALSFNPANIAALIMARFLAAMKKAATDSTQNVGAIPVIGAGVFKRNVGGAPSIGAGLLRTGKAPPPATEPDKGADAETRRRIRLLELEAEKAEAIARQGIAAENILFDQRRTSLKEFTDFQIREEELVLAKKKAVFAAERAEAEKLTKGRDLALGEIRLKELKADLEFADRKNQILATQQREEREAVKSHRQALLEIQDQADAAELARIEDFQKQGHVTAFDVASRRAEIEAEAFRRRRAELAIQLDEAVKNAEERQRVSDQLNKLNDESAESVRRNEQLKREAILETAEAYRDYTLAIREALETAADARRNAAIVALSRLNARVFLTERQRVERQFAIDRSLLQAEKRASDLRIDNAEHEAIEKAKKSGDFEEKMLQIQRTFNALRIAEKKRFQQEERKLDEDQKAALERTNPASGRSLLGDIFADVTQATGSALQGLLATGQDVFSQLSAQAGNMRDIMVSTFSAIGQAVGDAAAAFVLYGNSGTSFRKVAAQVIASVVSMSAVKAIFELAEGFAALARGIFGNPKGFAEAALHFKSAAIYGAVAGIAAVAGRAVAGNSFSDNRGTAAAAVGGGEAQPNNRNFNSNGQAVESSSQAAREGSGGMIGRLVEEVKLVRQENALLTAKLDNTLSRINSLPVGQVVTIGAPDARGAIAAAVIDHSNSSGDFNETLQRNLGFA